MVVCVGNVMVLLAEGSERAVLARFADLLAPDGRVLVGFSLVGAPPRSRVYPAAEFVADAEAAGLAVESRFVDLRPAAVRPRRRLRGVGAQGSPDRVTEISRRLTRPSQARVRVEPPRVLALVRPSQLGARRRRLAIVNLSG